MIHVNEIIAIMSGQITTQRMVIMFGIIEMIINRDTSHR